MHKTIRKLRFPADAMLRLLLLAGLLLPFPAVGQCRCGPACVRCQHEADSLTEDACCQEASTPASCCGASHEAPVHGELACECRCPCRQAFDHHLLVAARAQRLDKTQMQVCFGSVPPANIAVLHRQPPTGTQTSSLPPPLTAAQLSAWLCRWLN